MPAVAIETHICATERMAILAVSLLGIARSALREHVAVVVLARALEEMSYFYARSVVALM
jgi:hypothetical protein